MSLTGYKLYNVIKKYENMDMALLKKQNKKNGYNFFNDKILKATNSKIVTDTLKKKYFIMQTGTYAAKKFEVYKYWKSGLVELATTTRFGSKEQAMNWVRSN